MSALPPIADMGRAKLLAAGIAVTDRSNSLRRGGSYVPNLPLVTNGSAETVGNVLQRDSDRVRHDRLPRYQ
jgi:hypothetical protein